MVCHQEELLAEMASEAPVQAPPRQAFVPCPGSGPEQADCGGSTSPLWGNDSSKSVIKVGEKFRHESVKGGAGQGQLTQAPPAAAPSGVPHRVLPLPS